MYNMDIGFQLVYSGKPEDFTNCELVLESLESGNIYRFTISQLSPGMNYTTIYMDSDVEVLRSFDDLLDLPYFMGAEKAQTPEAAIIGAEKGCDWIKLCLDYYQDKSFVNEDGSLNIQTVPDINRNSEILYWFVVSSPLKRGLALSA